MIVVFLSRLWPLFWFGAIGVTLNPFVFIRKDRKGDSVLLAHESIHYTQQRKVGLLKFLFRYITSKEYRYQYELEAYVYETRIILTNKKVDKGAVISRQALRLASKTYGRMIDYKTAYGDLCRYL